MSSGKKPIKAAILSVVLNDSSLLPGEDTIAEASGLLKEAESDIEIVYSEQIRLRKIHSGHLLGSGRVEQCRQLWASLDVQLVFIDGKVSAVQQRNLQQVWNCPVTDRTGVILRVFKRHATSAAGRLQVRMAYLQYQRSRLVRCWKHLERQRGSTGKLSGPGEKQIELDRRLLTQQITKLKQRMNNLIRTNTLHRSARKRQRLPLVALVGYTSAGKSTLHNQLTHTGLATAETPFTTLDTVSRRLYLPDGNCCLISDTIGFVRELPPQLIAAFQTTLEDVMNADLILHIHDLSSPQLPARKTTVLAILSSMQISDLENKILNVYNKIDLCPHLKTTLDDGIAISALNGDHCRQLLQAIATRLAAQRELATTP